MISTKSATILMTGYRLIEDDDNFNIMTKEVVEDNTPENFIERVLMQLRDDRDFMRNCQARVFVRDTAKEWPEEVRLDPTIVFISALSSLDCGF